MRSDRVENRVKFKIGEIEFEAEGSAEVVERERSVFLNALLPAAVDAIVRTRGMEKAVQYIETVNESAILLTSETDTIPESVMSSATSPVDFSRTSLSSYIKELGKRDIYFRSDRPSENAVNFKRKEHMTLTQAMQILGIAEGQQISDEVAEAIRTVLAEMKQRVEIVRCSECCHQRTYYCPLYYGADREEMTSKNNFYSHAKRK